MCFVRNNKGTSIVLASQTQDQTIVNAYESVLCKDIVFGRQCVLVMLSRTITHVQFVAGLGLICMVFDLHMFVQFVKAISSFDSNCTDIHMYVPLCVCIYVPTIEIVKLLVHLVFYC